MPEQFDAIVIGSGQSGPFLAAKLAEAGMRCALVEGKQFGGTCVNNGCIPTKTLVASARTAHMARRAAEYGVVIGGDVTVDMKAVKARKDAIVQQSIDGLSTWLTGMPNLEVIWGHGRFEGPDTIRVKNRVLQAPKIYLNVGGRPVVPDWPGLADVPYLTSESMMDVDYLPQHLIVVGGSYIGLEFAQMYRRFGAEVTVVEHGERIIAREDPEVSAEVQAILEREGIRFVLGAKDIAVARDAAASAAIAATLRQAVAPVATATIPAATIVLTAQSGGQVRQVRGSHLLVAVGRVPNTDDLGLDRAGLTPDARGYIPVDDFLRTKVPGIWAMGDVTGHGAFTHTAYNDFEIVHANLLLDDERRVSDRIDAYALYTDPPLARIGMSETQVRRSGRAALIGVMPMTRVGRAKERGETQGFMKVLVDANTHRILGAALLCIDGDEVIHSLLDIMAADAPYTVIQRCMHIHPTVSELIPTLLGNLHPLV